MKKLFLTLYAVAVWIFVCFSFITHVVVCFLGYVFVPKSKRGFWFIKFASLFARLGFVIFRMKYEVIGLENVKKTPHFILAANHQSILDIPVLMIVVPYYFVFFAKKELLKVPILGWDLKHQGHFMVTRENPREAKSQMKMVSQKIIDEKQSVLVFPEGTRSVTGELGSFKRGVFMIAVQTGTPVIPVYIDGTGYIINKKRFLMHPGKMRVVFGEPIQVEKAQPEDERRHAQALLQEVEEKIKAMKQQYQVYDTIL